MRPPIGRELATEESDVHVATAPNPHLDAPLTVTIVVLPGLPARRPDGVIALADGVTPTRSDGAGSSDGELTWEDAAWY